MRERVRHLTKGVAIYGTGDAVIAVVSFFLIGVYVKSGRLTMEDFGAIGLIGSVEAFAKIISRWGLDGAFMRYYHECEPGAPRQRMASTIVWFMLAANGVLLVAGLAGADLLGRAITLDVRYVFALKLMFVNVFLMAFTFVPFHTMRLQNAAATFSAFTFVRSAGTVLMRIALVIGLRMGVAGAYWADLVLTAVLLPLLWPWFRPVLAPVFSTDELRRTLRFGLPRLPHGLASQTLDGNPKLILGRTVTPAELGVYQNGVTLGTAVSFFKNALEASFAPFYYATAREADARVVFSKTATYGVAVFVLLVAGTSAIARDAILLILNPSWLAALPVVPLVATAFALQGAYQLTSIGLNLTSRTEFYSVATITAALVSIGAGLLLIPRYGITGAASTVLLSYAVQAVVAFTLAQRVYPVVYEVGRLVRLILSGIAAAVVALWLVPDMRPIFGLLARGTTTVAVYVGLLWISGFFRPTERAFLAEMIARFRKGRRAR